MKKKIVILILAVVVAAGVGGGVWYYRTQNGSNSSSEDAIFVDSVAMITGLSATDGTNSRFSGVVEPQSTEKIELTSGLKVKETYVSVGDQVEVGTKLFSYDTDDAQDSITQLEIDIENYDISIESTNTQITQLEKERAKVSDDEKLSYTTQIMTAQNSIKRYEYEKKSKQAEMESLKKQIANADVTSPIEGIIKTINSSSASSDDTSSSMSSNDEDSSAYMTIMATGEYRIKGTINEQNMQEISEGISMIAYSRVDESQTWKGTLTSIDRENSSNSNSSSYGESSDSSMTNSSSYPFYVDLESSDGLMLGQHVYLMVDNGQSDEKDGLWLEDYYFILDDDGTVTNALWVAGEDDKLERREVTVGEYDEDNQTYEILDGLTTDDYIAYPTEDCAEGMPVTRNIEDSIDYDVDSLLNEDDDSSDDWEYIDGGDDSDDGEYTDDGEDTDDGEVTGGADAGTYSDVEDVVG